MGLIKGHPKDKTITMRFEVIVGRENNAVTFNFRAKSIDEALKIIDKEIKNSAGVKWYKVYEADMTYFKEKSPYYPREIFRKTF